MQIIKANKTYINSSKKESYMKDIKQELLIKVQGKLYPKYKSFPSGLDYHYDKANSIISVMVKSQFNKTVYNTLQRKSGIKN